MEDLEIIMKKIMVEIDSKVEENNETYCNISALLTRRRIKTLRDLEQLVKTKEEFIRCFCESFRELDNPKSDAILAYEELIALINRGKKRVKSDVDIDIDIENCGEYAKYQLSREELSALEATDKKVTIAELPILNPFAKHGISSTNRLRNVTVWELRKLLIKNKGEVLPTLNSLGYPNGNDAVKKVLVKSLTKALTLYEQANLRNLVIFPQAEWENNLYEAPDIEKRKKTVAIMLGTITTYILGTSRAEREKLIYDIDKDCERALGNINAPQYAFRKEAAISYFAHIFTAKEILNLTGLQEDVLEQLPLKAGHTSKSKVKRCPVDRVFRVVK